MNEVIAPVLPESLKTFMRDRCRISADAFRPLAPDRLPETPRRLLVHGQDMTSTLAAFHESQLRVELLRRERSERLYLREVFLRTVPGEVLAEYGVIAISLDQFTPDQQEQIEAAQVPLGALLHRCRIPFQSAPIGFFSAPGAALMDTPLRTSADQSCYGRFNRLSIPGGEPLAWILEILPPGTG